MATLPQIRSAFIVEDNNSLRETLQTALRTLTGSGVEAFASVAEAEQALRKRRPDLLLLDVELEDGNAFDVLSLLQCDSPAPIVIAISGVAGPEEGFRLAQLGVRTYLKKPLNLTALENAIRWALTTAPDLIPHVRATVGHVSVQELEEVVRKTMVQEALARSGGNRRGAARLLSVSRQLLQHMLRKFRSSGP